MRRLHHCIYIRNNCNIQIEFRCLKLNTQVSYIRQIRTKSYNTWTHWQTNIVARIFESFSHWGNIGIGCAVLPQGWGKTVQFHIFFIFPVSQEYNHICLHFVIEYLHCHSLSIPAKYLDNRLDDLTWDHFSLGMPFCPDFPYISDLRKKHIWVDISYSIHALQKRHTKLIPLVNIPYFSQIGYVSSTLAKFISIGSI